MISRDFIYSLLKTALERIQNKNWQQQVVEAWFLACTRGKWQSSDQLLKVPSSLLTDTCGIGLVAHTLAVTLGAAALAEQQAACFHKMPYVIDFDVLYAGGLLHDVGKLLEIESDGRNGYRKSKNGKYLRHPVSGAILAAEVGLPESVQHVIACHARECEDQPRRIETLLLHQADYAAFTPLVMKEKGMLIE